MRVYVTLLAISLAAVPLACGPTAPNGKSQSTSGKVELSVVSYAGLNAAVEEQKGKVVLIDAWFRG